MRRTVGRKAVFGFSASAMLYLAAFGANAEVAGNGSPCAERWGRPAAPLVSTSETAIAIFLAIEKDFSPHADGINFPEVHANDNGDSWTVFRWKAPVVLPDGQISVTEGGGQLGMTINKCTAAVSGIGRSK